ncbi:ion channel domain-containing protein [Ditylenchus destructor]|uniref:Ion channel domain-containing protein n=1 Tax=Ditylenchus destructor TaxID=166010 RepID=A0AAD4N0F4_9BILA|nr:ion channel domain-containing protein [Ditylenchus destructor]
MTLYSLTPSILTNGGSTNIASFDTSTTPLNHQERLKTSDNIDVEAFNEKKLNDLESEEQNTAMFCLWEMEWGYLTSVYFFFVSISTVGLGDVVPTNPDMMFINFLLILIGLALLSMCVNVIHIAIEQFIERLITQYLKEIENLATVVTSNEQFGDEAATPFEIGMTAEMLTVPITTTQKARVGGIGRIVKDWLAEKAANIALSRLVPDSSDSSSASESESDFDEEDGHLHVIEGMEPLVHGSATVTVVGHEGGAMVPKISIHEGTPVSTGLIVEGRKVSIQASSAAKDSVSFSSDHHRRKGSARRKRHSRKIGSKNPLANCSPATMQAIQAIETAKMCTYRNNDFKSRIFAKFATNERLARLVDEHTPEPPKSKMVSCSIQTTPISSPLMQRQRMRMAFAGRAGMLDSMDSSSDVGPNGDWTSTSIFDVDSLCSAGYFDLSFGGYSTDSVPKLMAEPNTPQGTVPSHPEGQLSQFSNRPRRFPPFASGFVQKVVDETSSPANSGMPPPFPVGNGFGNTRMTHSLSGNSSPPLAQADSLPPGSTLPGTPTIKLTSDADKSSSLLTHKAPFPGPGPTPSPSPTTSPTGNRAPAHVKRKSSDGYMLYAQNKSDVPLLGSIPLHHRALSNRRRFSANNCLVVPDEKIGRGALEAGPSQTSPERPYRPLARCPSCHHFSSATSPPIDTTADLPETSKKRSGRSTKIYSRNSIGSIDFETIRRVRDACGLLPSDFLIRHRDRKKIDKDQDVDEAPANVNQQNPDTKSVSSDESSGNDTSRLDTRSEQHLDDSGYSHSHELSSPSISQPISPFMVKEDKLMIINAPNVPIDVRGSQDAEHIVVEDVLERIVGAIAKEISQSRTK